MNIVLVDVESSDTDWIAVASDGIKASDQCQDDTNDRQKYYPLNAKDFVFIRRKIKIYLVGIYHHCSSAFAFVNQRLVKPVE